MSAATKRHRSKVTAKKVKFQVTPDESVIVVHGIEALQELHELHDEFVALADAHQEWLSDPKRCRIRYLYMFADMLFRHGRGEKAKLDPDSMGAYLVDEENETRAHAAEVERAAARLLRKLDEQRDALAARGAFGAEQYAEVVQRLNQTQVGREWLAQQAEDEESIWSRLDARSSSWLGEMKERFEKPADEFHELLEASYFKSLIAYLPTLTVQGKSIDELADEIPKALGRSGLKLAIDELDIPRAGGFAKPGTFHIRRFNKQSVKNLNLSSTALDHASAALSVANYIFSIQSFSEDPSFKNGVGIVHAAATMVDDLRAIVRWTRGEEVPLRGVAAEQALAEAAGGGFSKFIANELKEDAGALGVVAGICDVIAGVMDALGQSAIGNREAAIAYYAVAAGGAAVAIGTSMTSASVAGGPVLMVVGTIAGFIAGKIAEELSRSALEQWATTSPFGKDSKVQSYRDWKHRISDADVASQFAALQKAFYTADVQHCAVEDEGLVIGMSTGGISTASRVRVKANLNVDGNVKEFDLEFSATNSRIHMQGNALTGLELVLERRGLKQASNISLHGELSIDPEDDKTATFRRELNWKTGLPGLSDEERVNA